MRADTTTELPTLGESLRTSVERFGDGVGIWAQGCSEWIVTQLAAARVGAVLVTIDSGCDAAELAQQLRKGDVGLLLMERAYGALDRVQMSSTRCARARSCGARSSSRAIGNGSSSTGRRSVTSNAPRARRPLQR